MILITGSSGFVGRNLLRKLINKKHNICCLVRKETDRNFVGYLKKNNVKIIMASLDDLSSMEKELGKIKISKVIHLASVIKPNSTRFNEVNVEGTKNLVHICKKHKIKSFVYLSSYLADWKDYSEYGKSKYKSELLIKNSKLPYIILRSSVIYGKGDDKNIMALAKLIKKYPIIPVIGNGNHKIQPVFIEDISEIIIRGINIKSNKTYYVCSDKQLEFNDVIDIIAKSLNKRVFKLHVPMFFIKPIVRVYETLFRNPIINSNQLKYIIKSPKIDNTLIKKDLKFQFTDFRTGISKSFT